MGVLNIHIPMKFLSSWNIPIYYADGRIGHCDQYIAERIASGLFDFGATLEPQGTTDMARGPGRPAKVNTQAQQLSEALAFVSFAADDHADYQEHVRLENGFAIAYDGKVSAGHPIQEDLNICPHLAKLKQAIAKCGKTLAITVTPAGSLSVKGDNLRSLVPCLPSADMPASTPDMPVMEATDILKEAFKVCGVLATEAGHTVIEASLLLGTNTCSGTNRAIIMQFWHGLALPPGMVLPKVFTQAVAKCSKKITGFGCDYMQGRQPEVNSVTIWFEGGAWMKSLCYADQWPDIDPIVAAPVAPPEVPKGFFEGIDAVAISQDNGSFFIVDNQVRSHATDKEGAQYDVPGLQGVRQFTSKQMLALAPFAKNIDLTTSQDRAWFSGGEPMNPIRGCIIGIIRGDQPQSQPQPQPPENLSGGFTDPDDEVPY
jgi:hypothetical protein